MELKEMEDVKVLLKSRDEYVDFFNTLQNCGVTGSDIMSPTIDFPSHHIAGWCVGRNWISPTSPLEVITLAQFKERNGIMKYKQGDVLENKFGNAKILGVCGQVYFISNFNNSEKCGNFPRTEKELDNEGYLPKTDEPELVEITAKDALAELAKLKGIPVETLRIKD